jgi:hypothetical protein
MKKIVAVSVCGLLLIGLVTGGCGARTEVAKEKALEKIDSLLGSMDVKRKEIELSANPSSPTGGKIVGRENVLPCFWRRVFVSRLAAS